MSAFTSPKTIGFNYKRIPRKLKKKNKVRMNEFKFLTLNQKMWYILNPEHKKFLINEIIRRDNETILQRQQLLQ